MAKPKLPKRVQRLVAECKAGKTVCMSIHHSEVGDQKHYWLEPGGTPAGEWTVMRAVELGFLAPNNDGLFPDMDTQTYKGSPMRPLRDRLAELMRRARLGMAGGRWVEQTDITKSEWRASADQFISLARDFDIEIVDDDR